MPNLLERASASIRGVVLSWLEGGRTSGMLTPEEQTKFTAITTARKYYAGDHTIYLTDRQKAWVDLHKGQLKFKVNLCGDVVDSVVERLEVAAFAVQKEGVTDEATGLMLQGWWMESRGPTIAAEAHTFAGRDGEAFVLVDWDTIEQLPRFIVHQRFVDKQAGGDDFGMWMDYPNGNYLAPPIRAVKQWEERQPTGDLEKRQTRYYADRIERFVWKDNAWVPIIEQEVVEVEIDGEKQSVLQDAPWPAPWLMQDGTPIGIPVAHLTTQGMKSDLADVIPLQDILNKQWLDLLATSDSTGFRLLFTFGFIMTTDGKDPKEDGSNVVKITPGNSYGTKAKPTDATVKDIPPGELKDMLELEERIVYRVADVSDVPLSRFQTTKMVAAAETLKQQEAPFTAKVERRQTIFGDAWNHAMAVVLRMAATFGVGEETVTADPKTQVRATWKPSSVRDDKEKAETAKLHKEMGVPEEFLWKRQLGYTDEEIAMMKATDEYAARVEMRKNMMALGAQNGDIGGAGDEGKDSGGNVGGGKDEKSE